MVNETNRRESRQNPTGELPDPSLLSTRAVFGPDIDAMNFLAASMFCAPELAAAVKSLRIDFRLRNGALY